jgi:hypothetical protein
MRYRASHRWYRRTALAAGGLVGLISLVWSQRIPLQVWRQLDQELLWRALFYALFVWVFAFTITLCVYTATSMADSRQLLLASLGASVSAVWLSPALLLLSRREPAAMVFGFLLVANTARLLVSRRPPQRRAPAPLAKTRNTPVQLFAHGEVKSVFFSMETLPVLLGAFALQAGVYALLAGHVLMSTALFAGGAAIWTQSSFTKGAYKPRGKANLRDALVNVALVLILATALSAWQFRTDAENGGDSAMQRLADASNVKLQVPKHSVTHVSSPKEQGGVLGKDGIPGLVLRSRARSQRKALKIHRHFSLSRPLTIPFTGEYHLFRTLSGQLPPNSVVKTGTPLDSVYVTTNGGLMQMEAYQTFDPPIDFASCGRIHLTLFSGEAFPASASLQLIGGSGIEDLGSDIFGFAAQSEEVLEYAVPASSHRPQVNAIRVVFRPNPMQSSQSVRVSILQFMLMPRSF